MKGDFTRWTFDASKRYSSVRLQQGRVLLDADWNEQLDITAYREQTANKEIIGLNGVPDLDSFAVGFNGEQITLKKGLCYVEGVLCENLEDYQLDITEVPGIEEGKDYLVYLEVWQHHITAIEDEQLLEKALGGPDTTTRTQTYWRLKAKGLGGKKEWRQVWKKFLEDNDKDKEKRKLKVDISQGNLSNDLYRVEIHKDENNSEKTTFKWARNNASMVAKLNKPLAAQKVNIKTNNQFQPEEGNWIEITAEDFVKTGKPGLFLMVDAVQDNVLSINPDSWSGNENLIQEINNFFNNGNIITVRIWGAEAKDIPTEDFIDLENGLKVCFSGEGKYRTGDYWLIPTRSPRNVEWPEDEKKTDGIVYHYCPLAIVSNNGRWTAKQDCREVFPALTEMARETTEENGRKLSIGVHSYNDARRADEEVLEKHKEDQLDIQGGKQLTLNAGYWKDKLDGDSFPGNLPATDQSIIFSVNQKQVMSLYEEKLTKKEGVSIESGLSVKGDLTVTGTSHLQDTEITPTLKSTGNDQVLTALKITPSFNVDANHSDVKQWGLFVEQGNVAIAN
ncbi:MAG: hypothetical protein F6K58_07480, partial [Symploca sp. SIO2E9]|nr:hypothetical protein [Symploca sp. SIO2E9]